RPVRTVFSGRLPFRPLPFGRSGAGRRDLPGNIRPGVGYAEHDSWGHGQGLLVDDRAQSVQGRVDAKGPTSRAGRGCRGSETRARCNRGRSARARCSPEGVAGPDGDRPCSPADERARRPVSCGDRSDARLVGNGGQGQNPSGSNQTEASPSPKRGRAMNVTRQVINDLWPVYAAGEASADTRALVEAFLGQDPAFARALQEQSAEPIPEQEIPRMPLDLEAKALRRTQR